MTAEKEAEAEGKREGEDGGGYKYASEFDSSDSDSDEEGEVFSEPEEAEFNPEEYDNSEEANIKRFTEVLESESVKKRLDEEYKPGPTLEDHYDFPEDLEKWTEDDIQELWMERPPESDKMGWDPDLADEEEWEMMRKEVEAGRIPFIPHFYVPFRLSYPVIPDNHFDIDSPGAVIEELDKIEEFVKWASYIFPDQSSYEGTVFDDLAHGRGVYITDYGLIKYEGDWFRNSMQGHGVLQVDIPADEPIPGSKHEAEMRAAGHVFERDFMEPEDREWLEMAIEDSIELADNISDGYETPFYENEEWIKQYGIKPERGIYRYSGEWKHGRMHGCGIYQVNDKYVYGRFYFGIFLQNGDHGCDENISTMHSRLAEISAAKARMFTYKPDGMVREDRGPYTDPQHHYFYEEENLWMAPGFINQFAEIPDKWKVYASVVDEERQMWLNSFYKSPLRIPNQPELDYWWKKYDEPPEFVLVDKETIGEKPDADNPLILHVPTGRLINYVKDEKHIFRFFYQPNLKKGEKVDLNKVEFLPLGYDDDDVKEAKVPDTRMQKLMKSFSDAWAPALLILKKWAEKKIKTWEEDLKLLEEEIQLVEAELHTELSNRVAIKEAAKREEKEVIDKAMADLHEKEAQIEEAQIEEAQIEEEDVVEEDEESENGQRGTECDDEEGGYDGDEEGSASSFGFAHKGSNSNNTEPSLKFGVSSLSFNFGRLQWTVPCRLDMFFQWRRKGSHLESHGDATVRPNYVRFPPLRGPSATLRASIPPISRSRVRIQRGLRWFSEDISGDQGRKKGGKQSRGCEGKMTAFHIALECRRAEDSGVLSMVF